jgi:hypothetical protein
MTGDRDDIWLQVHHLSVALDDAGLTRDERLNFATEAFNRMPPMVRRELLHELRGVAADLLDLTALVVADQNQGERLPAQLHSDAS